MHPEGKKQTCEFQIVAMGRLVKLLHSAVSIGWHAYSKRGVLVDLFGLLHIHDVASGVVHFASCSSFLAMTFENKL